MRRNLASGKVIFFRKSSHPPWVTATETVPTWTRISKNKFLLCLTAPKGDGIIPSPPPPPPGGGGRIAEFGVYKGKSINFFARSCPKAKVYGFDSFEGLEEDWYGFRLQKGFFSTNGQLPKCERNVILVKGWFEDTLPKFCRELKGEQIQLLHMDADTYKPTSYVLNSLTKNLGKGTIIIFDEYFGYSSFRLHEFKAWQEFVNSEGIKYQYIGYTELQVAIEIL
jgi:hypothetical protein